MLNYMDADSFIWSMRTNNLEIICDDFEEDFDFSEPSEDHPFHSPTNEKILWRNENRNMSKHYSGQICSFEGKSYSHSCVKAGGNEGRKSKLKGIQKAPIVNACLERNWFFLSVDPMIL